ncbi:O-antigen ligase family protein [Tropicimonas sp. TH_r6]|uniref:O-antigen ligase family protein n=1 Tax=Tropicimonas sp. TH_r6 TaxID=3082085 RepID=UPI00295551C0|nr:O-antigen ligase family protein [Tropicimonas sp. TH_r6]MDV7145538.1 O-antigen ligase family protein [Tropicimonas sp. TH_r6]
MAPGTHHAEESRPAPWIMPLYFCVTLMPIALTVAGLRLSPLRVMLLVLFVPYLFQIFRGAIGRTTAVDVLMMLHALWIVVALFVVHGPEKLPFAGITMVELVGGYFMGRALVRNSNDYRRMIRLLLYSMIFLFPFALIELFTGRLVIPSIVGVAFETIHRGSSAYGRMGLERVYAVFEHPILYGMFCSLAIANLFYMARGASFWRYSGMIFAIGMTFMSLSSAPLLACGLQILMILWDKITKGAWKFFIILGTISYVVVDLLSNRTPLTILIETLTFNSGTGWTRIAIFEFGIQNAYAHPIFGLGFNDWERPFWLTASVDNFWLLTTMRYGFVGAGFLVAAFLWHFTCLLRAKINDDTTRRIRTGYTLTLAATCLTMATVHVWGAVGVFVMFYLGAGAWLYTTPGSGDTADTPDQETPNTGPSAAGRYSRFESDDHSAPHSRFAPDDRSSLQASQRDTGR